MHKILLFLFLGVTVLFSAQIATVTGLDPNGDGFLSLRAKPKGREIGKLYNGNKVKILKKKGKYYKVKVVKSGMVGYAHGNWIRKSHTSNSSNTSTSHKQGTVHGLDPNGDGFLSLRNKPKGRQIGKLYNGDHVDILATRGKWYKVKLVNSDQVGWAHGNWVRVGNIKRQQTVDKNTYDSLFKAIKDNNLTILTQLLAHNTIDANYNDKSFILNKYGRHESRGTLLYYAFKLEHMKAAKILLSHGANINQDMILYTKFTVNQKEPFKNYCTVFTEACSSFPVSTIEQMLSFDVDMNRHPIPQYSDFADKGSPLYNLTGSRYVTEHIVKLFLSKGTKVDNGASNGLTPLYNLLIQESTNSISRDKIYAIATILLEHGANPNHIPNNTDGHAPIHDASEISLKLFKLLEQYGGKSELIATGSEDTMLHLVKDYDLAKYLISKGLDKYLNKNNNNGEYPIEHLFENAMENKKLIELFIKNGSKVNIVDKDGNSLLHHLVESNFYEIDQNNIDKFLSIAKLLIDSGVDIKLKNNKGKSAIDIVSNEAHNSSNVTRITAKAVNFFYEYAK